MNTTKYRKMLVLKAVLPNAGIMTRIAEATGVHRSTIDKWKKVDKEFLKKFQAEQTKLVVFAATQLMKKALDGDTKALITVFDRNIIGLENNEVMKDIENSITKVFAKHGYRYI